MMIDSHVHLWLRPMYPDRIVMSYLEPLLALEGGLTDKRDREEFFPNSQMKPDTLMEWMPKAGVDRAVILPLDFGVVAPPKKDVEEFNDWVFDWSSRYPDKLIGFMGIDPQRGDQAIRLMRKYHAKYEPKGIKIYPPTGWYPYEERVANFWKEANDMGLAVVTHSGAAPEPLQEEKGRPVHFKPILDRYPDLHLVIAHLGGMYRKDTYEMAADHPNLYVDCSALQGWLPSNPEVVINRLKEAISVLGPDRIMFGSDFPLFDLNYPYENWCSFMREQPYADESTKEKILGLNAQRIFRL
ncbi:MAG: amidohydrolase family protein [Methanomassiliicoccales archaeon]|jgi:hypothetical protein